MALDHFYPTIPWGNTELSAKRNLADQYQALIIFHCLLVFLFFYIYIWSANSSE